MFIEKQFFIKRAYTNKIAMISYVYIIVTTIIIIKENIYFMY